MTNKVTLPAPYAPLLDQSVVEIVERSGRTTAKTTSNEIAAIIAMLSGRDGNVWYCRAQEGDIRKTIFSSMIATIQLAGLEGLFRWSLSPLQVVCTKTKAICYFSGINGKTDDDLTATKGFTPQYRSLALCILDEADQAKHYNHITAWKTTALRFLKPGGKIVYAYNPPMSRSHWAHRFFGDMVRNGATEIYCTWRDIEALLSKTVVAEIEKFERDDPEYYRYWYLGEPVNFRGMVYPQFRRDYHVVNIYDLLAEGDRVMELIIGIDEGTANDSTCATAGAKMLSGRLVVLDCFENDPLVRGQQSPTEQSNALWLWISGLLRHFPFLMQVRRLWIFECAEGGQMLMLQFRQDTGEDCGKVTKKSIEGDIKRVRNLLAEGILFFHVDDFVTTEVLIQDIENYVFDEKTNTVKKGHLVDMIDSMEYMTKLYFNGVIER